MAHEQIVTERRFPPPWTVADIGAAFVVRDQNGQGLAHVYYEAVTKVTPLSKVYCFAATSTVPPGGAFPPLTWAAEWRPIFYLLAIRGCAC